MKRFGKLLLCLVVLDILFTVAFFGLTRLIDQTDELSGGTGVVFYTGDQREADARVAKGLQLLDNGKIDRLLMVGGHRPQDGIVGSQDMALMAIRVSGHAEHISAEVDSRDTISGLEKLASDPTSLRGGEPVLISSCLHLLRAKTIFNAVSERSASPKAACTGANLNPISMWKQVHYETAAWVVYFMPESWRDTLIDRLRGGDAHDQSSPPLPGTISPA